MGKYVGTDYQKADYHDKEIKKLSDRREELIKGGSARPPSAETLKVMLQEIDSLIAQQKKIYFLGDVNKQSWTGLFEMTPTHPAERKPDDKDDKKCLFKKDDKDDKKCLFIFAKEAGVCELLANYQGVKIPPAFQFDRDKVCEDDDSTCQKRKDACKSAAMVVLRVEPVEKENVLAGRIEGIFPKNHEPYGEELGQKGDRGFYYRIPAKAAVRLISRSTDNTVEHGRRTLQIAQLGWVVSLPASTGGRKTKYDLALDPLTGALANFNLGTDPLIQKAMLEDIKGIATPITDAKDELKQLQRAREILEERQKVRVAADALQRPLPTPTPATNN